MPEKVTREEKQVEMAILKAKEIIQEAEHLGILELDEPSLGEDFKVKRPKKNPSEVPIPKTSNIEGKEKKENDGKMKKSISMLQKAIHILSDSITKEYGTDMAPYDPMSDDANPVWEQERTDLNSPRAVQDAIREMGAALDQIETEVSRLHDEEAMESGTAKKVNTLHTQMADVLQDLKIATKGAAATPAQQP